MRTWRDSGIDYTDDNADDDCKNATDDRIQHERQRVQPVDSVSR